MKLSVIFTHVIIVYFFLSCSKPNETNISSSNERSHNFGKNCMDCHKKGGNGKGWFNIAGSVYLRDTFLTVENPGGNVKLFTQRGGKGSLIASVDVDARGNFFTTEKVDFGNGLYPFLTGPKGDTVGMNQSITTGACGSCHNYTTFKIYVK